MRKVQARGGEEEELDGDIISLVGDHPLY